jgi:hypothetical protein
MYKSKFKYINQKKLPIITVLKSYKFVNLLKYKQLIIFQAFSQNSLSV